jgi:DUF4097 and DUF4098 domain-containing protein YvlB
MRKYLRHILILTSFLITVSLLSACGFSYRYRHHYSTNRLDRDDAIQFEIKKTEVEPITKVDILCRTADVELIPSDKFFVEIDYLYWDQEPEYSLQNGIFYFNDSKSLPNNYSINFNLHNIVRIYLPQNSSFQRINIENASGEVSVAGFIAEKLDITVSYGDLSIKKAAAIDAEVTLSSGTSKISDFEVGKLDYRNAYGNAHFTDINTASSVLPEDSTHDQFQVTMSSGDVKIDGLNCKNIGLSNSFGDITCDKITAEDLDLELSSGRAEINGADILSTDINNSFGDVDITMVGEATDYNLDLDTFSGKIKVDGKSYDNHLRLNNNADRNLTAKINSGDIKVDFE